MPVMIRGRDDGDRYPDNANDTILLREARKKVLSLSSGLTPQPLTLATTAVSEVRIIGSGGDDSIVADKKFPRPLNVRAGAGKDTVLGGAAADTIAGGSDDDFIRGRRGNDLILGGTGNEEISGSRGQDVLFGDEGNDRILGRRGIDLLCGGNGNDALRGWRGSDILDGGIGSDSLTGGSGVDQIHTDALDALLQSGEIISDLENATCSDAVRRGLN